MTDKQGLNYDNHDLSFRRDSVISSQILISVVRDLTMGKLYAQLI